MRNSGLQHPPEEPTRDQNSNPSNQGFWGLPLFLGSPFFPAPFCHINSSPVNAAFLIRAFAHNDRITLDLALDFVAIVIAFAFAVCLNCPLLSLNWSFSVEGLSCSLGVCAEGFTASRLFPSFSTANSSCCLIRGSGSGLQKDRVTRFWLYLVGICRTSHRNPVLEMVSRSIVVSICSPHLKLVSLVALLLSALAFLYCVQL